MDEEKVSTMPNILILQASARSEGNTHKIIQALREYIDCDVVDLNTLHIEAYTYSTAKPTDDFLPLIRDIISKYDVLIFATPVYWYAMSGILKHFLDRLTDCITVQKELGRQLRGKKLASLACGSDNVEVEGFHAPFRLTADYLDMEYIGSVHTWIAEIEIVPEVEKRIEIFGVEINRCL